MAADKKHQQKKIEVVNRRAQHEYFFLDQFDAGIVLSGTEIKSIRAGNVNLNDAYCLFVDGELWIKSMYIKEYEFGTDNNHVPRRDRKLLLRKTELKKLDKKVREKGNSIIPYKLFINDRSYVKINIALATGKKTYDKRATIQARDDKRDIDRLKKEFTRS